MYVAGFSFIRNAIRYDYPIAEALASIMPMCDELVVAVGKSEDGTEAMMASLQQTQPKLRLLPSIWDDTLREGGRVLAVETDKAQAAINPDATWAVYIQGDEVLHEDALPLLQAAMQRYADDKSVEGLLLPYRHFYGSYDYVGDARNWYRREIRVVRPQTGLHSYKDAQGFRIWDNGKARKLKVKLVEGAWMHHYGWVKHPDMQRAKAHNFNKYWHNDDWMGQQAAVFDSFDYGNVDSLAAFAGTQPSVMLPRIAAQNWSFSFDVTKKRLSLKKHILQYIERLTGLRLGEYRNYNLLGKA